MKAIKPITIELDAYENQVMMFSLGCYLKQGLSRPLYDLILVEVNHKLTEMYFGLKTKKLRIDLKECFALREYAENVDARGDELQVWRKIYNLLDHHILNTVKNVNIHPLLPS